MLKIDEQGTNDIWRASELDKALLCYRQLGYSRLGVVALDTGEVKTVVSPWNWKMVGGLAMDDTMNQNNLNIIHGSPPMVSKDLGDYFVHRFTENARLAIEKAGSISGDSDPNELMSSGRKVLSIYEEWAKEKNIVPVGVQVEGSVTVGDLTLVGHIDLIREAEHPDTQKKHRIISDYKFTSKTAGQMPASNYSRGWAYDLMSGDGSGHIELILLRGELKTPKIETTNHFVTPAQHAQVKHTLVTAAKMMKARIFPMVDPGHWVCNSKWCSYWAVCRGSPVGPMPIPGETVHSDPRSTIGTPGDIRQG